MTTVTLDELLGPELAAQLTPTARLHVENLARGHHAGVRRVAREILRDTTIRNPAAVLLSRLDRKQHITPGQKRRRSAPAAPLPPPPPPLTDDQRDRLRRWGVVSRLSLHHGIVDEVRAADAQAERDGTDRLLAAELEIARLTL